MTKFQRSPIFFIRTIWKLEPQAVKEECQKEVDNYIRLSQFDKIKKEHFEKFVRGKNFTWQQWQLLVAVEQALIYGRNKISVVSGRGTGKSATMAWLVIWYLFCHYDAQVGATAPTTEQMHDVLWKEVALWMGKMPKGLQDLFDWQAGYIRVKERPETWFARARTARKEAPEAMSGLHGENVLILADEASGVPDEIFMAAEGSMTGPNVLTILISNGTRNEGYFYDTHHDEQSDWVTLGFNSEDSPIVESGFVELKDAKSSGNHDSDDYKVNVLGQFPSSETMDDHGWVSLVTEVAQVSEDTEFSGGRKVMAVDPSGEGDDTTVWVIRDNFVARVVATEVTSSEKSVASRTLELMREHEIRPEDVVIDNFGIGANVSKEMLLLDHKASVTSMNWGEEARDEEAFINLRAEACFNAREWLLRGGAVVGDELKKEILAYQYKNTLSGKKQILDKVRLKKKLRRSPDRGDAFFMSFIGGADLSPSRSDLRMMVDDGQSVDDGKFSAI